MVKSDVVAVTVSEVVGVPTVSIADRRLMPTLHIRDAVDTEVGSTQVGFAVIYETAVEPRTYLGLAVFDVAAITAFRPPQIYPCAALDMTPWLVTAHIEGTAYGAWKNFEGLECGKTYELKLKEYKEAPTFYVEFEVRDIIGKDVFADIVTRIEAWMLEQAGFELVEIKQETKTTFRVYYKPPWSEESPLWVLLAANWKFIIALVLIVAILAIIYLIGWKFGEKAVVAITGLGALIVFFLLLSAMKPKEERR